MGDTSTAAPLLFNLAGQPGSGGVSPLEQEVLDEYARLLRNMNHVRFSSFFVSLYAWHFACIALSSAGA